ncbi:response regulator [Phenylobacterium aquaticum]|uniref:response regulator n=1 Tax=Phenylobacterium aquaticum TaxID=1763816 RepID=UPI0026EF5407|nr:response regulator [Phenylobacterium aquaticum]
MTMRIMVVEDDALIALDMVGLLEELGHEVVAEAADANTAWSRAETSRPDLALVDIRLARNTDGGKLALRLYDQLGIRSLFISGSITEDFRRDMARVKPVGFLGKPVTRRTLGEALKAT